MVDAQALPPLSTSVRSLIDELTPLVDGVRDLHDGMREQRRKG